jgi:Tfp pilus assembly protein PilV
LVHKKYNKKGDVMKSLKLIKRQRGLSAIETLFVILIATLALIGALALGYKMFGNQQNSSEQENIANLLVNARSLKGSQGYGAANTNLVPQLIAIDGVPDTMTVTAGVIYNSWGGTVTVTATTPTSFTLTASAIPQAGCVALATRVSKSNQFSTKIGSATAVVGEIGAAAASSSCVTGATGNTIAWTVSG